MRFRKLISWMLFSFMIIIQLELASRVFCSVKYGVPFFKSDQILCLFYPEAKNMLRGQVVQDPAALQILVLGASVMAPEYGNLPLQVGAVLQSRTQRKIQIYNVSRASLSSRDSLIKYRHLGRYKFDLVIFYHGINDTRANNVAEDAYRDDYSHYGWYDAVNAFERHPEINWFALPFMLEYLKISIEGMLKLKHYMPSEWPDENWIRRTGTVRTADSFARNVEEIVRIAKYRGEKVLLITFCDYKASGYTRSAFEKGGFDYAKVRRPQAFPIELWGDADFIPRALADSNDALRRIAREQKIFMIDMQRLMPKKGEYFIDYCHFSSKGVSVFRELTSRFLLQNLNLWAARPVSAQPSAV